MEMIKSKVKVLEEKNVTLSAKIQEKEEVIERFNLMIDQSEEAYDKIVGTT